MISYRYSKMFSCGVHLNFEYCSCFQMCFLCRGYCIEVEVEVEVEIEIEIEIEIYFFCC